MKFPLKLIMGVALTLIFFSCSNNKSVQPVPQNSDSAAAADMLKPDDFDTVPPKKEEEPEQPRIVAYSSNEAIELMQSLPGGDQYMQGILPKLSQESLDYALRLLNNAHDGFIIVDKEAMKVVLYDRYGREMLRYGIACGKGYGTKHKKGDSRTPEGFFSVEGIYDSTDWLFRDDNGRVSKVKGQFGPRFIRLRIPGTSQIGIHGTRAPWSIGSRCSHGCIRVTNDNIMELVKHVKPGMPVIVSPSRRDEKVNVKEGYDIPWVSVSHNVSKRKPVTLDEVAPAEETQPEPVEPKDSVATDVAPLPEVEPEAPQEENLGPLQ